MAKTVSAPATSSLSPLPPMSRLHQRLDHARDLDVDSRRHIFDRLGPKLELEQESEPLDTSSRSSSVQSVGTSTSATPNGAHASSEGSRSTHMEIDFKDRDATMEQPEEEEEEEDEVMSEGVVHVNARLAPVALSPQRKSTSSSRQFSHPLPPLPPSISTAVSNLNQHHQQLDSPKTPTSAKTPRTPRQTKMPKLPKVPRMPKRSQSDYDGSGSSRGKNKDPFGDYFYSPFPPSASPASSPSSPSSFQAQLQMLTHNFVSIQPHVSPTSRFRRVPTSIITSTPPFSPPASPGVDLLRDSPFHIGSGSTTTSPIKGVNGNGSVPTTPAFARSVSGSTTPQRTHFKPRWHTQPYMMFLALRAMPDRTAARQELIMAAVELDKKFSAEKGLPRVFTGKTPMNSASACLTNNGDKYFIPFKPEGSRSTHFRLAYQPGDFDTAVNEYNGWMEQLIERDWPLCFGTPKDGTTRMRGGLDTRETSPMERGEETRPRLQRVESSPESRKRGADHGEHVYEFSSAGSKKAKAENGPEGEVKHENGDDSRVEDRMQKLDIKMPSSLNGSVSCPPTPTVAFAPAPCEQGDSIATEEPVQMRSYRLEDLDLSRVPTCLSDIVRVDVSSIPNAGNGLFAKMDLPAGTPLGFYFGVPMTENEFDSLKDGVGVASQYSVMYRRTVLDATDEHGQPYTDPQGPLYCPFHFMNEDPNGNVSFITGSVVNQVICTTNRDVKVGEELFVFYGKEMDRHWGGLGQDGAAGEDGDGRKSRGGSRSRASSPTRRSNAEESGRPRRETVYKPARYTR
ncbi:hypothetical protein BGZ51_001109 [Haplosporangium sp. Z 767]|nr:hypothetical protein BGZ50_001907 [Haplosporangium sp. Z 11]KAF9187724.1 hypothetical protein BGZ51_001109 [Haplosporangium sp. Z 767]